MFEKGYLKKLDYALLYEYIFLILMALMIIYYFLNNTTFGVEWPPKYVLYLRNILTMAVILRIYTIQTIDWKKLALMGLVILSFYVSYVNGTSSQIVDMILMIVGSCDIKADKIASTYFVTTGLMMLITVISSIMGLIDRQSGTGSAGGIADYCLGTTNSFWIMAYIFYLTCAYLIIRREKITYEELILLEAVNIIFFIITHRWNQLICITVILICLFMAKREERCSQTGKTSALLGCLIPLLCSIGSILACAGYDANSFLWRIWNKLLQNQLSMGKAGYDALGLSLWGKKIATYGQSYYGSKYKPNINDFVINNGYMYMAIKCGIVVFLVFILLLLWMNYRLCQSRQKIMLIICCVNAIHLLVDRDMFFVNCNFLIWCTFASFMKIKTGRAQNSD